MPLAVSPDHLMPKRLIRVRPTEVRTYVWLGGHTTQGTVREGDWDLDTLDIATCPKISACLAHWRDGVSWEDTGIYDFMMKSIARWRRRGKVFDKCHTFEDVVARYERIDRLYHEVRAAGRLATSHERGIARRPERERGGVLIHVGREGKPIFGTAGHHRLAMAMALGLEDIPAVLGAVHPQAIRDDMPEPTPAAKRGYQERRDTQAKFDMLTGVLDFTDVKNILDVGCNQGFLTAKFAEQGKFAVGLDIAPHFAGQISDGPAYGVLPMTVERAEALPEFDAIFLLSVHHQWHKLFGDGETRRMITALAARAKKYFIIEIAAIRSKYGFPEGVFVDNDEASVVAYGQQWLESLNLPGTVRYLGKNPEHARKEPHRFAFVVERD